MISGGDGPNMPRPKRRKQATPRPKQATATAVASAADAGSPGTPARIPFEPQPFALRDRLQRSIAASKHLQPPTERPRGMASSTATAVAEPEPEFDPDTPPQPVQFTSSGIFLNLPQDVMRSYAEQALAAKVELPQFIAQRLRRAVDWRSASEFVVTDAARQELGKHLSSALIELQDLVRAVRGLVAIRVTGHESISGIESPIELLITREDAQTIQYGVTSGATFEDVILNAMRRGIRGLSLTS